MRKFKIDATLSLISIGRESLYSTTGCVGAVLLSEVNARHLKTDLIADWGNFSGFLRNKENRGHQGKDTIFFKTVSTRGKPLAMMSIKKPTTVIFVEITKEEFLS